MSQKTCQDLGSYPVVSIVSSDGLSVYNDNLYTVVVEDVCRYLDFSSLICRLFETRKIMSVSLLLTIFYNTTRKKEDPLGRNLLSLIFICLQFMNYFTLPFFDSVSLLSKVIRSLYEKQGWILLYVVQGVNSSHFYTSVTSGSEVTLVKGTVVRRVKPNL